MSDYILELEEACNVLKDNCAHSKCLTCIFYTNLSKPNCRLMDTPETWPVNKIFNREDNNES